MNPAREPKATRSSTRTVLLAMLCLVWSGLVVAVYYISHKPGDSQQLQALLRLGLTSAGWVGSLSLAHGLARRVAPSIGRLPPAPRLRPPVGLGVGGV